MDKNLMIRGFYRINKLMQSMIDCKENKQELIRLGNIFMDDAQELIALLYVENNINDEDLEKFKQEIVDIEEEAMKELNDGESVIEENPDDGILPIGLREDIKATIPAQGEDLGASVVSE